MPQIFRVTSVGLSGAPAMPYFLGSSPLMGDINFALQLAGLEPAQFAPTYPLQACRVGDQGVRVVVQVLDGYGNPVNVRTASVKTIKYLRPDGTAFDGQASLLTNGLDGYLYFASTINTPPLDQSGTWWVQAKVTIGGNSQSTQWGSFAVQSNIDGN